MTSQKLFTTLAFLLLLGACEQSTSERTGGATSQQALIAAYEKGHMAKDFKPIFDLIYKPDPSETFDIEQQVIEADFDNEILDIKIVPLQETDILEYEQKGITYVSSLPPIGKVHLELKQAESDNTYYTEFFVGELEGRVYIVFATEKQ